MRLEDGLMGSATRESLIWKGFETGGEEPEKKHISGREVVGKGGR